MLKLVWNCKRIITRQYRKDFESSSKRTDDWVDGKVTAAERRILFTWWVKEAEEYIKRKQSWVKGLFKRCGMANDILGRENHLIKVRKHLLYEPPKKEDDPAEPLSPAEIKAFVSAEHLAREQKRQQQLARRLQRRNTQQFATGKRGRPRRRNNV
eukprot:UN26423